MRGKLNSAVTKVTISIIMLALIAGMIGCVPISQNLEIRDWYDLDAIRNNLDGNYILINDLDSTTSGYGQLAGPTASEGNGWQPIGTVGTEHNLFTGTFDGQGFEIRDLFINRADWGGVGLFGFVYEGVVENIGVVNANVTGYGAVGGLVGGNLGNMANCYATGSVTGHDIVGGLLGYSGGNVSNSHFTGSVTGTGSGYWGSAVGGLMGANAAHASVTNSYSGGSVTGYGQNVGGLLGLNLGSSVSSSYSTGSVSGQDVVGGLVGVNVGTVSNSHATGSVIGTSHVGGLAGANGYQGTVSNSYSTGNVTGASYVGGLVGWTGTSGIVNNSYYDYAEVSINGENMITTGALFAEDFDEWLANDKFLDVNERLSQENGYYLINSVSDFKELLAFGQDGSLKFRLTNDLDLADEPNFYIPYLAGEFDGNGHKISNFSLSFDLVAPLGLFGYLAPGGNVAQVGAENINVTGYSGVGGLVGCISESTVGHSYSTGSVSGNENVGGLVGENLGNVSDSYATGNVTGDLCVGGLAGYNRGTLSNSYASSTVTGNSSVGGLVGHNYFGTVSNCYSSGTVTGNSSVGGLVGQDYLSTVSNSFWDTQTSGQAASAGGTGKNTTEMKDIDTFSGEGWDIIEVAGLGIRNLSYIWNIVNNVTYPFLSWQPV